MMIDAKTTVKELLRQKTPVNFAAGGVSMNPTIRDGELVRVRPVEPSELRHGDIVLYPLHERLILHRIIEIQHDRVIATGDAALEGTETIERATILGIAESVRRDGTFIPLDRPRDRRSGLLRYRTRRVRRWAMMVWRLLHAGS
jgi:signal peptidase I